MECAATAVVGFFFPFIRPTPVFFALLSFLFFFYLSGLKHVFENVCVCVLRRLTLTVQVDFSVSRFDGLTLFEIQIRTIFYTLVSIFAGKSLEGVVVHYISCKLDIFILYDTGFNCYM